MHIWAQQGVGGRRSDGKCRTLSRKLHDTRALYAGTVVEKIDLEDNQ